MGSYKPSQLVSAAAKRLKEHDEPEIGARYLMMDLFSMSVHDILLDMKVLSESEKQKYEEGIERLVQHEPLSHITGFQEFYGRPFDVNRHVLTPRTETETLIECVLNEVQGRQYETFADIGTGSGIIAITVCLELHKKMTMYATDISDRAIETARANCRKFNADIIFMKGDLLEPFKDKGIKLDVLLSNPPYIAHHEKHLMNETALNYDPEIALYADDDGLLLYKRMIDDLPHIMNPNGFICFEIGHLQGDVLTAYINEKYPDIHVKITRDVNGQNRVLSFTWCE